MSIGRMAGACVMAACVSGTAWAQTAPPQTPPVTPAPAAAPASKPVTVTGGMDVTNAYLFRGILQEDEGFIGQPWIDLGLAASNVTFNFGNWNSLHSADTGKYYEADFYASATFVAGKFKPGLLFTSYQSPNDTFKTVNELAAVFSFDDSANKVPLSPKIVLAFELSDGQADGGANKGTYLELGIKPALKAAPKLTFLIPLKLGMSLNDYYEGVNGSDTFGFFDAGLLASVPLGTSGKVSWEMHGGIDILWLGDNLKAINGDDGVKPVGSFGISFTY